MFALTVAVRARCAAGSTSDTGSAGSSPRGGYTAHALGRSTHSSQTRSLPHRWRFRTVDYPGRLRTTLSDINDAGRVVGDHRRPSAGISSR
jgi:hypothetical protein